MAHQIRVFSRPHVNVDGSESKSKRDWYFRDRKRNGVYISPPLGSEKAAREMVEEYRTSLVALHEKTHPNDKRGMKKMQTKNPRQVNTVARKE